MRKIKWKNVLKLIAMLISAAIVIYDVFMLGFSPFFTGEMLGWTWYGFITFIISCFASFNMYFSIFEADVL